MRIGLDVRMIGNSGIGTTIQELLNQFSPEQKKDLVLLGNSAESPDRACVYKQVPYPIYGLKQHWAYGRLLNKARLNLYHMPHYDVPYSYRGPLVVTVHDLIHYLFPQYSTKPLTRLYSNMMLHHVTRAASHIITVSENTKRDLLNAFPRAAEKTTVLYPAVDRAFAPVKGAALQDVLVYYRLLPGYLLYIGNLREGKNTRRLLRSYERLAAEKNDLPPLVLAGRNSLPDLKFSPDNPRIRYLGEVPAEDLPALYSGASLFVFPSLYEGFGLPPLEAMACGTPVITSSVASLPEVCGDAAMYVDPLSERDIAEKIWSLCESLKAREVLRSKGFERVKNFSWSRFADGTWKIYEDVARGKYER